MVARAARAIGEWITALPNQPMHKNRGAKRAVARLRRGLPEKGEPFERLLRELFHEALPRGLNTASPGYLAYVPGGGLLHASIADLVTSAVNRYVGVWIAAPGLVQIEADVIDWCAGIVGLPAETRGGLLTSGGSMANLIATFAARRAHFPRGFERAVAYVSDQSHHSVLKALMLAGIEERRTLETDARCRIRPRDLARAIADDRAKDLAPFLVIANAGTTNTGAVDPLGAIADVCAKARVSLHVDGAYGGFFALTDRGRKKLEGIERADSVTLDPHKGLFLPYGTGCLVVRDVEDLRRAHHVEAAYMPRMQEERELVDFCEISPELSREARGVRVWLPMRMHGAGVFRAQLDEKIDLARYVAKTLASWPDVEVSFAPELSLLAFRVTPPGVDDPAALDRIQHRVQSGVNKRQRVLLSNSVVKGRTILRVCVVSFRTHKDRIDAALEDIRAAIDELA
ncbi:MAG: aminotransferase class I/II-fold pyridoxal phosphate-dependent enzyme [Polyangiaceae bacterium]